MPSKLISIGELIDHSWDRYREHFGSYIGLSAWILIVAIMNVIALALYPSASNLILGVELTGWQGFGVMLFGFSSLIVAPLLDIWILVTLVRFVRSALNQRTATTKRAINETKKRFWPTVVVSVMYLLILLISILIAVAPAGILSLLSLLLQSGRLLAIGNGLLVIGVFVAVYLFIRWGILFYFATYLTAQDDVKGKKALVASRNLVHNRYWAVLFRIVAPKVVFLLFAAVAIWLINLLIVIVVSTFAGLDFDLQVRLGGFAQNVIPLVVTVFVQPLIILSDLLLIRSLTGE